LNRRASEETNLRRDPKDYESVGLIHKLNKLDQEEANRKSLPHPYKKHTSNPGDDDYVEDVL
jgi:hypothetical protein